MSLLLKLSSVVTRFGIAPPIIAYCIAAAAGTLGAATLPPGFVEAPLATGLSAPTAMALAVDGRIFVAEQSGTLRVIKNGALLATPFLTLTVDSSGERGLLGVAFDPNFGSNHFVYVYYTVPSPAHNRVSRFTANGDVAVVGSEVPILDLNNLSSATNHNGGALHFGPDGKLYIAVGENANGANSQTLGNLLGKILRINSDGTIPTDNPFFGTATGVNRAIWAYGLRNPYTFSFQPGTGRMFINDVGQSTWEEINDGIAGSNYGWPLSEGPTSTPGERGPVYFYGHTGAGVTGCAITGGSFYNPAGAQFPASFTGKYFFADYCSGWIKTVDPANGFAVADFAAGIGGPVDLMVDPNGSLYYLAHNDGTLDRIDTSLAFTGAASRKVHGGSGTFDLPLALTPANPTTEPRSAEAGGAHTIVLTFGQAPISGLVAVTEGTAVAGAPTFSGNDMIVPLTGVTDQQYVTVSFSNVASAAGGSLGGSVRLGFLVGDVNQNRVVTVADLGLVNAQLAQPVTAANFLTDVNATGTLTVGDKGITNANLTRALPAP